MPKVNVYAIYSLWLREMIRFFRLKSRVFGSLAPPFFFLAFLGFGFRSAAMPAIPEGVDYISFLAPGIIGMTLLFSSTFGGLSMLWTGNSAFSGRSWSPRCPGSRSSSAGPRAASPPP
ncbi:MAG TPA: hypothetical protein PLQ49_01830 [Methanothrix sp.]|nr:hypothetical protein [Methanothrix sp.]